MNNIRERWFMQKLKAALSVMPVTVVIGARQTGKTTLVNSIYPARTYNTLDDLGSLDQAQKEPDQLLSNRPLTLDEVQRVPSLFLAVKRSVDKDRRAGDFLLTGSANLLLMEQVADTLAGRAVYLELPPFCPAEWRQRKDALAPIDNLFKGNFNLRDWPDEPGDWASWLLRGGFPPALQLPRQEDRALWFAAYVQTYLERDLRQLSAVSSLPDFQRLMAIAALRTGRLLNQADLARDAALSHPTAHRYINLLETGNLITRIRPFANNPGLGLVKSPKLMWTDCGLAASLAGLRSTAEVYRLPDRGFWLEQTIFQTLQSWRALDPLHRRIHFWRNRSGMEVDFILEQDRQVVAIEIKSGSTVTVDDTAGIRAFREAASTTQKQIFGIVLHAGSPRPIDAMTVALPWGWMVPAD